MKPYFHDEARRRALDADARSWVGTPFFRRGASKGPRGGVDCVMLAHELMVAAGAMTRETVFPGYSLDHAKHSTRSVMLRWILDLPQFAGRCVMVPVYEPPMPGDLVALKSGFSDHHLAVVIDFGQVVHAVERRGVIIHDIAETAFRGRVLYVLRLMEVFV
ncbi:hypothetical protein OpiT1DRAFT_00215 [Opitutaceae bacterium TAV1]|nr:hypothetical protein OpiT1DRAFT_00215 [Opitutaceae bacterium TAV1]